MDGKVNWASITSKLNRAVAAKIEEKVTQDLETIAHEFETTMDFEIADSPGLTPAESERVSMVPFQYTGKSGGVTQNFSGRVKGTYKLYFDFLGDKTMVSLSPNKSVHDLIALFNNGYASNNVRPDAPIRGIWHGREIVIKPRSRQGAHFIGRAIEQFQQWCAAYYPKYNIRFKVNPNYNSGAS